MKNGKKQVSKEKSRMDKKIKNLQLVNGTLMSHQATFIWEKPDTSEDIMYDIYLNNEKVTQRKKGQTHITLKNLTPETIYELKISVAGQESSLAFETPTKETVIDITKEPYNVDPTGKKLATKQLQKAINDCPKNGIVLIPKGTIVLSGAIDLKSFMCLQVDGTLLGSLNPEDYTFSAVNRAKYLGKVNEEGLILTRFEGWELFCYRSLINAGYLVQENRHKITCENIAILGEGKIIGGGNELGLKMREIYADTKRYPEYLSDNRPGRRVRGRLISFIQTKSAHLTGVSVENSPSWTCHFIYCDQIITHDLTITSQHIDNGDGWDPDSSKNCLIFATKLNTSDDCIAIKSGKNPDGNKVNIPTKNIRIFDLKMTSGNGMAIGSEQSGGVENVLISDCEIQGTRYGIELKAHNDRGGYIKNITIEDCTLDSFEAQSVMYNSDGQAAEKLPDFENVTMKNCTVTGGNPSIKLVGFQKAEEREHFLKNFSFENVMLKNNGKITLKNAEEVVFKNVLTEENMQPVYEFNEDNAQIIIEK